MNGGRGERAGGRRGETIERQTIKTKNSRPRRALFEASGHHPVEQLHAILELGRGHAHGLRSGCCLLLRLARLRRLLRGRRPDDARLSEHCWWCCCCFWGTLAFLLPAAGKGSRAAGDKSNRSGLRTAKAAAAEVGSGGKKRRSQALRARWGLGRSRVWRPTVGRETLVKSNCVRTQEVSLAR